MVSEKYIRFVKDQLEKGILPKDCIPKLKEYGSTQRDTVLILIKVYKMSLKQADELVLFSKSWKEKLEINVEVRNTFLDVIENHIEEE